MTASAKLDDRLTIVANAMQIENREWLVQFVFREFNCLLKPLHPEL